MKFKPMFCLFLILCTLTFNINPIQAEVIAAESAILMDASSKNILFEKNAYAKQYPASITKLMTALLAIENLNPSDTLTFSQEAIFGIERGSSHIGLDVGEQITVDEGLHGLMLMSANEVANGLAEAVSGTIDNFAQRMTLRAKELGALNTNFVNPHGLHDENHYTTAYDMALIGSYLCFNDYFLDIMQDTTYQIPATNRVDEVRYLYQQHSMLNPTKNPQYYREYVIGGKTGYTDQAKHTLVTMARQGDTTLVAVVLKSDKNTLYSDTIALLDYGFEAYNNLPLHTTTDTLATLPLYSVKSGIGYQAGNCSLGLIEDTSVLVHDSIGTQDIVTNLDLPEYIPLGSQIGDVVGKITYLYDHQILRTDQLVIKDIAYAASPFETIMTGEGIKLSKSWYIVIGICLIFCLIIIILWLRKHRKRRRYKNRSYRLYK